MFTWGAFLNSLKPVTGVLPNVLTAREFSLDEVIVPLENVKEAALVEGVNAYAAGSLAQLAEFLSGELEISPYRLDINELLESPGAAAIDFSDIKGQQAAKRALEVAAAGGHNLIMLGSPGSGKTLLARSLPGILPEMTFQESIEVTKIHSLAGLLPGNRPLVTKRPFRSPHHTASPVSIIGGGRIPKPGEVSLAHNGVLFLDEMPEFHKETLEALRQPLEDGIVTISRINASLTYPARLMLVGALNPCPCGYYGDPVRECSCTPTRSSATWPAGPLLDRLISMWKFPALRRPFGPKQGRVQQRLKKGRVRPTVQRQRFQADNKRDTPKDFAKLHCNACMTPGSPRIL